MLKIGDTRRSRLTGRKQIYISCISCGELRWTNLVKGQPRNLHCRSCANWIRAWKGGISKGSGGYINVYHPNHPKAFAFGCIGQARDVLENKLGRYLRKGHLAHHKNEIRDDNRPENLEEISLSEHTRLHALKRHALRRAKG